MFNIANFLEIFIVTVLNYNATREKIILWNSYLLAGTDDMSLNLFTPH